MKRTDGLQRVIADRLQDPKGQGQEQPLAYQLYPMFAAIAAGPQGGAELRTPWPTRPRWPAEWVLELNPLQAKPQ
ncbi:hypothetical protein SORBI_3002G040550 [Sorghum bicolor]|uniref:Uncharacterized protein n=1 Tax=Sorghum bicolor TaxID=4558 RepID=A0A1W0W259_SORBI|nr:hypothetical protein SORBI_3002G040550 [Sorghum bicolor]